MRTQLLFLGLLLLTACQEPAIYVNDQEIPRSELRRRAKLSGLDVDDPTLSAQIIRETLMLQDARQFGLEVEPEAVEAQIQQARSEAGGDSALRRTLRTQGISMRDYRRDLESRLLLLRYSDFLTRQAKVSTEELEAYYEENKAALATPARWGISIYCGGAAAEVTAAQADFPATASLSHTVLELSEAATGWQGEMVDLIRRTSLNTPSDVFPHKGETCFLVPERYYRAKTPEFDSVREVLKAQLEQQLGQRLIAERLAALEQEAVVRWEGLEPSGPGP